MPSAAKRVSQVGAPGTGAMPQAGGVSSVGEQPMKTDKKTKMAVMTVYGLLILLGLGTGYVLAAKGAAPTAAPGSVETDTVVGSTDTETFKDWAEGTLEKDGDAGEGTHKLIREGGPSQTAYLISSVVDLDKFVGKKVKVWGQTVAAQKVSWLMDVGKVELLQ